LGFNFFFFSAWIWASIFDLAAGLTKYAAVVSRGGGKTYMKSGDVDSVIKPGRLKCTDLID
jgi:hypothetical protein